MSQVQLTSSPTEEVVAKVNRLGLTEAAKKFNTSRASLSRWLKSQGYKAKPQYMKVDNNEGREPIQEH
jgi:hypothetical protein